MTLMLHRAMEYIEMPSGHTKNGKKDDSAAVFAQA